MPFSDDAVDISRRLTYIALADANVACHINLKAMNVGERLLSNVTLHIIHYDLTTDVSVLFTGTECRAARISTADELYQWAIRVGEKYGAKNVYGGIDPAEDEDTRLLSRTYVGPHLTI